MDLTVVSLSLGSITYILYFMVDIKYACVNTSLSSIPVFPSSRGRDLSITQIALSTSL